MWQATAECYLILFHHQRSHNTEQHWRHYEWRHHCITLGGGVTWLVWWSVGAITVFDLDPGGSSSVVASVALRAGLTCSGARPDHSVVWLHILDHFTAARVSSTVCRALLEKVSAEGRLDVWVTRGSVETTARVALIAVHGGGRVGGALGWTRMNDEDDQKENLQAGLYHGIHYGSSPLLDFSTVPTHLLTQWTSPV